MRPRIRRGPLAELPPEVAALAAVAFMVALGFGVVAPAIPLFAKHFGVSKTAASAVISAFAAARLCTAPFVGRLVNTFGERIMLAAGIGIVSLSSLLAGLAQNYVQLLALRGMVASARSCSASARRACSSASHRRSSVVARIAFSPAAFCSARLPDLRSVWSRPGRCARRSSSTRGR